ncbi:MAG: fibronectin type III domain-containing protein [Bacteroidota bacterium]
MKKNLTLRLALILQVFLLLNINSNFAQSGSHSSYVPENSVSSNAATLNWNGVQNATDYTIRYRPVGTAVWSTTSTILTSTFIENLNADTEYEYQVSANSSAGRTAYSASEFFHTGSSCTAPDNLSAVSMSSTSVQLNWRAQTGINYYKIKYRVAGSSAWTNDSSATNTKIISGLTPSASYQYQVQTKCNSSGQSAWSPKVSFSTSANSTCAAPDGISTSLIGSSDATINWNPVAGAVNYTVQYARSGSNSWTTETSGSNTTTLTGLEPATSYNFRVQAQGYGSVSAFTNAASFQTQAAACGIPTMVSTTAITATSARLTWGVVTGASSYSLRYRRTGTSSWTTTSSTTNSKDISGLIQNTGYEFQVKTVCSGSSSSYAGLTTFTTAGVNCNTPDVYYFGTINKTSSSATIYWTAISGSAGYNVRYKVYNSTGAWTNLAATAATLNLTGLLANTKYEFQVQTICSGGTSAFSASGVFTTAAFTCGVPSASTFSATSVTTSGATLQWGDVSGSNGYNVQYRVSGASTWTTVTTLSNSKALTGLSAATSYQYQVQTICSGGNSSYSGTVTFTTSGTSCAIPDVSKFTSTNKTSSSCTVGWKAIGGSSGYNVQYKVRNSTNAWNTVNATTNSANLSGLAASTWYEFQVQTICSGGTSTFSASGIFATTASGSICAIPTGLTVVSVASTTASFEWIGASGASSYNVRYKKTSTSTWITAASSNTSETVTGLSAGSQYEFQVQTICAAGSGDYSASVLFMTTVGSSACGIPDGLSVSAITTSSASLLWAASSSATSYVVRYKTTSSSTWTTATSTNLSESIAGLSAGSAYEFQVQSVCASGSSAFSASYGFTTLSNGGTTALPVPDHVVIVVFENHAYSQIIGNSAAPRINAFAQEANTTVFTESYAITHPSQPNWLHLFSGSNQGVTNNVKPSSKFNTMNLAAAVLQAGLTFKSFADGMPSIGYDGDVSGTYARKHNPVANWVGTGTNQVPASLNLPFTSFPSDYSTLPTVSFVCPDMNNSMHDGSGNSAITTGDNWFYSKIYPYAQWAKTHNSLLIVTFDEDNSASGNRIPTIFSGQMVTQGTISTGINHYNVLRTIEDMYGLQHSGNAANASPIHGCWVNGFRVARPAKVEETFKLGIFPNPVISELNINYTLDESSDVEIRILDVTGKLIKEDLTPKQAAGNHEIVIPVDALHISKGVYFVEMNINETRIVKRIVVGE